MTTLPALELSGVQRPRLLCRPQALTSAGAEAVELARSVGLTLDPWQAYALDVALGERADGKWAAFEVGLVVPRQNGKGSVLEARELAGLFLFGERLILHSAHEFKTAAEAFRRVKALVDGTDWLRKRVRRVYNSHGDEGIELMDGARLRFVARTGGSGRGFSGDCVVLDEAYALDARAMGALLPTLSARPNPQIWYTSSAPMEHSAQLHAVRERALAGGSERLAYLEWSVPDDADVDDEGAWAQANPALGIRIGTDFVRAERDAMPLDEFRRERLGIPDMPPSVSGDALPGWRNAADLRSQIGGAVCFAVAVASDRSWASIGVAGWRADGRAHLEVVEHDQGTAWVAARLARLVERWRPRSVRVLKTGGAASLLPDLEALGAEPVTTAAYAASCGRLYDAVTAVEPTVRHLQQVALNAAVSGARTRTSGDAWVWDARASGVDVSPLEAVTLAFGALGEPEPVAVSPGFLSM